MELTADGGRLENSERLRLRDRIRRHVAQVGGCWVWQGAKTHAPRYPERPYGYIEINGRRWSVRRLAYLLWDCRPALGKRRVRAVCGNSLCCNPDHLRCGDQAASPGAPPRGNV